MPVYLLDVNVLIALSVSGHRHHRAATDWFGQGRTWATTPITESSFVRLMSNPRVVGWEVTPEQALQAVRQMITLPGHTFVPDDARLMEPSISLVPLAGTKQVTDFHLINLAAQHGLCFATFDGSAQRALQPDDRRHVEVLTD